MTPPSTDWVFDIGASSHMAASSEVLTWIKRRDAYIWNSWSIMEVDWGPNQGHPEIIYKFGTPLLCQGKVEIKFYTFLIWTRPAERAPDSNVHNFYVEARIWMILDFMESLRSPLSNGSSHTSRFDPRRPQSPKQCIFPFQSELSKPMGLVTEFLFT